MTPPSDEADDDVIIRVRDLRKSFGGITAVDGASFDLERAKITGLIGPNGAGKTTTFNLLTGFYRPDGGNIWFKGQRLHDFMQPTSGERRIWWIAAGGTFGSIGLVGGTVLGLSSLGIGGLTLGGILLGGGLYEGQQYTRKHILETRPQRPFALTRAGLVRTFQITRELGNMTVLENLMLGPQSQRGERAAYTWFRPGSVQSKEEAIKEEAFEILELLELTHLANDYARNLSGGQRKLLELGRVLMTEPELILLDEPVAGVNPSLQENLLNRILDLRDEGYTFCIVEHDMDVIMRISDEVIVMDQGDVLVEGPPEIIREDERVIDAYLGGA